MQTNGGDEDVISGSGHRKRHLGADFAIWSSGGAWFGFLINASGEGAIIGASMNEAQAIRDACISIEETLTAF